MHFKISMWKVAQGLQGGHRRATFWTSNNSTNENVRRVREALSSDRRLSIRVFADTLNLSTFAVHGIVTQDLQMRKVCAKLVPKVLTEEQKKVQILRSEELLELIKNDPGFLNSAVTGDETWCPSLLTALTWLRAIFFLFPRLKREMKGKHWESVKNTQALVTRFLKGIPVERFQGAFQAWHTRLRKCIDAGEDYFEEF